MSCEDCLATAIRAKLGRCAVCAAQTFLIGVVGWLVWWWCGADTSVNALTGLLFALGARVSSCCIWRCSHGESWANATYNVLIFQEDK